MSLGANLSRLRTQAGMSQDALAEQLGVSRQSVSKWETDASVPELDRLVRLAELFHVSLDELVRDIPPVRPEPEIPPAPPPPAALPVRKIVGIVLLGVGALLLLLLTAMAGLDGLLTGLILALPFAACGVICLVCRKRVGLWCGWTAFGFVDSYLRLFTSTSRGLVITAFFYPAICSEMSAQLIFAWAASAWYLLMILLTLRSFRSLRLPRDRKTILLLAAGWAARLVALPAVFRAIVKAVPWQSGHILQPLSLGYDLVMTGLAALLVVGTVAVIRKR